MNIALIRADVPGGASLHGQISLGPVSGPLYSHTVGRRRGWLIIAQTGLLFSIIGLGASDPAKQPFVMAMAAFLVTFFSASQDIVADAYRREDIPDAELRIRLITVYQRIPDRHAAGRRRRADSG
ncbi:MAG: hypothetical protein R2861_15300 [Desulfobacterales bacterium]